MLPLRGGWRCFEGGGRFQGEGLMKGWLRRPNPLPPLKPPPLSPSLSQQSKPSLSKGVQRKVGSGQRRGVSKGSILPDLPSARRHNISLFFPSPTANSVLSSLSWGPFVELWPRSTQNARSGSIHPGPHPSGPHSSAPILRASTFTIGEGSWTLRGDQDWWVWIGEKMWIESEVRTASIGDGDGKICRSRLKVLELKNRWD